MQVSSYIFFNGNCAAALAFYQKVLGAEVKGTMTYGASPVASHVAAEMHDKILHADLRIGGTVVMASDARPDLWSGSPHGFSLCIGVATVAEAETVFAALTDGGKVDMAMGETFFAERFGSATDKFGIPWMVICEKKHG